jgi:small GTP-binding protein
MPANLPPQYFEVEKKYRDAKDPHEKLALLQELLAIIPKHKGTEKLQADLKTKISKVKDTLIHQKKSKGTGGSWYQVEKQGAGQVVCVGLPNAGKSSLLNSLTNAHVEVALYPFTTQLPQVGMIDFENVKIQLIDTPPLHDEAPAWLYGLYRNGDILLIVLDITGDILKDFETIENMLGSRNIFIRQNSSGDSKKVVVVPVRIDKLSSRQKLDGFVNEYQKDFVIVPVANPDGRGVDVLKRKIFEELGIIRVYTKKIGKSANKDEPIVLRKGTTLLDAAEHIHKDFKKNLKFARLWNDSGYTGQRVEKNHILADGDVIEFHV